MRNAPAVHYPVGRCRFHGWLVLLAGSLGFAVITGWNLSVNVSPVLAWSSPGFLAVVAAHAGYRWYKIGLGELVWTGQVWQYASLTVNSERRPLAIHDVRVVLDLQSTLLIRVSGADHSNYWLWSERRRSPVHWLALRRALFAFIRPDRGAKPHLHGVDDVRFSGSAVEPLPPTKP